MDVRTRKVLSKVLFTLGLVALIYVTIGLGFHVAWKYAWDECRNARIAHGEFVESEVFSGVLALLFNVTNWPVYAWANWYHFGTVIATPCSR